MGWGQAIGTVGGGVAGGIAGGPVGAAAGSVAGGWLGGKAEGSMARAAATIPILNVDNPQYQAGGSVWVDDPSDPNGGYWQSAVDAKVAQYDDLGGRYARRADTTIDYGQANADYAQQQQAREQQMGLAQQYQDVIAGKTPSLAEMQMRRGQEDSNQAALNLAASARGGGALLAQQQGLQASALGQQRVNQDAAMLRAQETAQARDAYGNLISGVRGQDLGARSQSAEQAQAAAATKLQSEQQRYQQGFGYRAQADQIGASQRDSNVGVSQGNQSAKVALATGQQQAAAAQRAAMIQGGASLVGSGLAAYAGSSGGKK